MTNIVDNSIYALYRNHDELRDAAKTLRTNLEFSGIDHEIRSVAVTSAEMSVGKSTIGICLGFAMAETGKRVLLIDNDFRNPQVAMRLKVRSTYTLSDLLAGKVPAVNACVPTREENLYVLDLGNRRLNNPVEVMSSAKYKTMIQQLGEYFDFVIIDTPPIGMFIDAALASQMVDGVLFVINSGKTSSREVKEALSQLEKANARVLGAVISNVHRTNSNYYYYDRQGNKKRKKSSKRFSFLTGNR